MNSSQEDNRSQTGDAQAVSRGAATNMDMFGRKVLLTPYTSINEENLLLVLSNLNSTATLNQNQAKYLRRYYEGMQPILYRSKDRGRTEICNKVEENWALDIADFQVGYLLGEPVQYVTKAGDTKADAINELNRQMSLNGKESQDVDLADDFTIAGTSYRLILPNQNWSKNNPDEPMFKLYVCSPERTFVVYNSGIGHEPLMGILVDKTEVGDLRYTIYTATDYFVVLNGVKITEHRKHKLGGVPIIEYPNNKHRLGGFEIVLPLLDAVNTLQSNRLDAVEAFVNALFVLKGVDIQKEQFQDLLDMGALSIPADADAKYLVQELNQEQGETLKKSMVDTIFQICGIPNRRGGASASDNGVAVIYRDGWSDAETRAKRTELIFTASEKRMLKIALNIMRTFGSKELALADIDIRFTRRNYENIQGKAQVFTQLSNNPKLHPKYAFDASGLFKDSNLAYKESMDYYEKNLEQETDRIVKEQTNGNQGTTGSSVQE